MTDLEIVGRDLFADDTSAPGHAIGYSHVFANTMDASFDSSDDQMHGGGGGGEAHAYFTQNDDAGVFEDNDEGADFGGSGSGGNSSSEAPSVQGPSLLVNRSRLVFETRPGQSAQSAVELHNNGSIALLFSLDIEVNPKFTSPLDGGLLLPGERKQLCFSFSSQRAGTFLQHIRLVCDPPPPREEQRAALVLLLKGMCVQVWRAGCRIFSGAVAENYCCTMFFLQNTKSKYRPRPV